MKIYETSQKLIKEEQVEDNIRTHKFKVICCLFYNNLHKCTLDPSKHISNGLIFLHTES